MESGKEEEEEATETFLKAYYEGFIDMNHSKYHTIKNNVEEDRVNLRDSLDYYNCKDCPTKYSNYRFMSRVSKYKIK